MQDFCRGCLGRPAVRMSELRSQKVPSMRPDSKSSSNARGFVQQRAPGNRPPSGNDPALVAPPRGAAPAAREQPPAYSERSVGNGPPGGPLLVGDQVEAPSYREQLEGDV